MPELRPGDLCVAGAQGLEPRVDERSLPGVVGEIVDLHAEGAHDARLTRLGLPWRVTHLRAAVSGLVWAQRGVHLHVVVADAETTRDELVEACVEVTRLMVRWPQAVTVSAKVEGQVDPWIAEAVGAGLLDRQAGGAPLAPLLALRERWMEQQAQLPLPEGRANEPLLRRLDDLGRRVVFEMMQEAWLGRAPTWPAGPPSKSEGMRLTSEQLGEEGRWIKAFRQFTYNPVRRMVVIPTWQCELRCSYCFIPKQDGRVMSVEVLERSIEMLLGTDRGEVMLQFFGGEALLEYALVQHGIDYATRRAAEVGKRISFVLSSNGWSLTEEKLSWLRQYPVRLELSLDGDAATQTRFRPSRFRGEDSYHHSIATHAADILASGIEQWVIMVVHPTQVDQMPTNFFHILDLGFRRIQINNMLGRAWTPAQMQSFARGLHTIGLELIRRWGAGEAAEFINMNHQPVAMRLNGEVTVDWDGTIYGGNAFLHETEHKSLFVVGHLDDLTNIDRFWVDATDNNFLLDWSYKPHVTANNVAVGRIMSSFIKWMKSKGHGPSGPINPIQERRTDQAPEGPAPT